MEFLSFSILSQVSFEFYQGPCRADVIIIEEKKIMGGSDFQKTKYLYIFFFISY